MKHIYSFVLVARGEYWMYVGSIFLYFVWRLFAMDMKLPIGELQETLKKALVNLWQHLYNIKTAGKTIYPHPQG